MPIDFKHHTLDNGLTILAECDDDAHSAAVGYFVKTGARDEAPALMGVSHFLEHMMFKGTERFSKKSGTSVFKLLQTLGARVNATTWNDRTNYYELLPSRHLETAIEIEADRMRGALLDPAEVESEKTVILNEFDRGENEPLRKLYHSVWSTAFEAHPYHHPTIGWRSDIENATPESLGNFYDRFYWPNNATISVIGGFDIEDVLADLLVHFGQISSSPHPFPEVAVREPEQRGERRTTIRMAGGQRTVLMAHKSPPATHPHTFALHLASLVLSHGKTSRLYGSLVDAGLASGQSSSASSFRDPGLFTTMVMLTDGATAEQVEGVVQRELERLAAEPITQEEYKRALSKLEAMTFYARDGSFSAASELNEAIAAGDWKLYTEFLDRAHAVSREDIQRVSAKTFVPEGRTVGIYDPVDLGV